jgi:hypothetical protein
MRSAYNSIWLYNLGIVKEAKTWLKSGVISAESFNLIAGEYKSGFYHPNVMIRLLLFVATLIGLAGVTGILVLMFQDALDEIGPYLSIVYGVGSLFILELVFIGNNNHYKSGVTEALLYHSIAFICIGASSMFGFQSSESELYWIFFVCMVVFSFSAFRYLDLISTICALGCFAYLVFFIMYNIGGIVQQLIPIVFIAIFTPMYFLAVSLKKNSAVHLWNSCILVLEVLSLIFIYAAGNYFVVRELSVSMMSLEIAPGEDIPLAFVFYLLTVLIPITYLFFGIRNKDVVLLRVSLAALAFSVFTFKYYYSLGHHEITFTASGILLLAISFYLFRLLKTPKNGFTRENVLHEKWAASNPEAFIISQTLGGNKVTVDESFQGGGGTFGGGGSSGNY